MLCKCMSPAAGGGQGHAQVTHSRTAGLSPRTTVLRVLEYGVVLVLTCMVAVHLSFGFPKKERLDSPTGNAPGSVNEFVAAEPSGWTRRAAPMGAAARPRRLRRRETRECARLLSAALLVGGAMAQSAADWCLGSDSANRPVVVNKCDLPEWQNRDRPT